MKNVCINCLSVLGTKSRVKLYLQLQKNGPLTVSQLVKKSNLKQPTVSYHLIKLESCGLLVHKNVGKENYYSISQTCVHDKKPCIMSVSN